jgi:predicted Zn-dependent protease
MEDAETAPFTNDGQPINSRDWVENGVLKNLSYSRFWAEKKGKNALPAPSNLAMIGGNDSLEDMIRSTQRGVLITRFWYIRSLNPRTISYTGLTRDGTFLIENGKISRPVNNFRFNQSLAELLKNIEMVGPSVQVAASENSSVSMPIIVPAVKVSDFTLASVSDAI